MNYLVLNSAKMLAFLDQELGIPPWERLHISTKEDYCNKVKRILLELRPPPPSVIKSIEKHYPDLSAADVARIINTFLDYIID